MNWLRREGTGHYLNEAGLTGTGLLVGPAPGPFSTALLAAWRGRELLVAAPGPALPPSPAVPLRAVAPAAVAAAVPDGSLDFAYLGGDPAAAGPLGAWAGKVRPGGLVAGGGYAGAGMAAVDAHARSWGLAAGFTAHDPDTPDWFVRVPAGGPPAPDRVAVVTAFDAGYAAVGAVSRPNKEAYCARHGYRFVCRTDGFDPDRPASWSKLHFVREALAGADWVFWTDADSLVMNPAVPVTRFCWDAHDLVLSGDPYHGLNLGCWLARRSPWTLAFLDRLLAMTECRDHPWWENAAALACYAGDPAVRGRVGVLPNKLFNAYPYPGGGYAAGDFVVHFPGMDPGRRAAAMADYAARAGGPAGGEA